MQVLECLALHKTKLSDLCHKKLFNVRKQEFQDSSSDFALINTCRAMLRQFCHDVNRSGSLDCLKRYKDDSTFDDNCRSIVIKRMIEQNTDYRFNTALQSACIYDIERYCKGVKYFYFIYTHTHTHQILIFEMYIFIFVFFM